MSLFTDQQSFLNYFQNELWITRTEKFLSKLDTVVPWEVIAKQVESSRQSVPWGVWRRRTQISKLIKILFLQWLYGLSDPKIEDQIRDRNSFQKFLGISKAKDIPDETTICRFRNELADAGKQEDIFTMTQCMLAEMGFNVEKWHIQDGTIIEAPKWRKNKEGRNTRDTDASFTKKNARNYHGYKGHIQTSEKWTFIMNTTYTKPRYMTLKHLMLWWPEMKQEKLFEIVLMEARKRMISSKHMGSKTRSMKNEWDELLCLLTRKNKIV